MALYKNIIQWDWNLEDRPEIPNPEHPTVGEYASFIKYSFGEINLDPVFRVIEIYPDYTAELEVVMGTSVPVGTRYSKLPLEGLRRVKLGTIQEVTSSSYSASTIEPQPTPIQILSYRKDM